MARPAPDPERVVEVYELVRVKHYSYRQAAAAAKVSVGTVSEWVRTAHGWWAEAERVSRAVENDAQMMITSYYLKELHAAYERGDITVDQMVPLGLKVLERRAKVKGSDEPTRVSIESTESPLAPEQAAAVRKLRERMEPNELRIIEGETA